MSQSKIIPSVSLAEDFGESHAELKNMLSKMQIQQEVMATQLKEFAALPIVQKSCEYQQLKFLATSLPLFNLPSETFDEWYFKYGEIFREETTSLNDRTKVQLLVSRLGELEFKKYTNSIAPLGVSEPTFRETIAKLMSLFAKTKSLTNRRLQYVQLQKDENEETVSYCLRVDKAFCAAEMGEISTEELKCLMFVHGLKSPKEAELRKWLIERMDEKGSGLKLSDLQNLCEQFKENNSKKPPIKHIAKTESLQAKVWRTLHLDFFHIEQDYILVLFDSYSHWPEVYVNANSKAATIVDAMQAIFSRFGLPHTLVLSCDSSLTQVNSKLFVSYCDDNDIICTAPVGVSLISHEYYLHFKEQLKRVIENRLSTESCIEAIRPLLVEYRNKTFCGAPNQKTTAEIMLGRSLRVKEEAPPTYFVGGMGMIATDYPY
ncbi:uncharacterized protein LOC118465493 [Anopheles albimanus]|uniref:DUF7083 domain-containing protein n=1 Tax=Anopheles albimanus TaxID=7167 RepID=A0A182FVV0_ANOAL|nr:uncharacterized protein LOC118465493 [Anopheles albimanus]